MSPIQDLQVVLVHGFPRVSGDEPPTEAAKVLAKAFSPRERG